MQFLPLFLFLLLRVRHFRSKRNSNLAEQSFLDPAAGRSEKRASLFSFHSANARRGRRQWLLRDSVLTAAQLMRKFTRNVVVARVVYATMSAII